MPTQSFLYGIMFGALLTFVGAWVVVHRHGRLIREAERKARQAARMAEIGAMTGGLAHEIKNPLSTLGLNAQLLSEAIQDLSLPPEETRRLTNRTQAIQRETDRLRGILQDFLEYAGKVHLELRDGDLNNLVSELADFYQPEAERQGVRLRLDLTQQPLMVRMDARAIKQAVLNLMINATQAIALMPGVGAAEGSIKGDLILRTGSERVDVTLPGSKLPRKQRVAALHVTDTGPGMSPETCKQIFEPYFTTKSGGSGLGLPTSRRLIEEHGGQLGVISEAGKGSDFCLILPLLSGQN